MTVQELIDELQKVKNKDVEVCLGDRDGRRIFPEELPRPAIARVDHEGYMATCYLDIASYSEGFNTLYASNT